MKRAARCLMIISQGQPFLWIPVSLRRFLKSLNHNRLGQMSWLIRVNALFLSNVKTDKLSD